MLQVRNPSYSEGIRLEDWKLKASLGYEWVQGQPEQLDETGKYKGRREDWECIIGTEHLLPVPLTSTQPPTELQKPTKQKHLLKARTYRKAEARGAKSSPESTLSSQQPYNLDTGKQCPETHTALRRTLQEFNLTFCAPHRPTHSATSWFLSTRTLVNDSIRHGAD